MKPLAELVIEGQKWYSKVCIRDSQKYTITDGEYPDCAYPTALWGHAFCTRLIWMMVSTLFPKSAQNADRPM